MRKLILLFAIFLGYALSSFAQKIDSTKTVRISLRDSNPMSVKDPLIVIDGNKQFIRGLSAVNGLDPNSIESVTILKDSSAVALYGADGLAGVVIIKTKETAESTIPKNIPSSKIEGKEIGISLKKQNPTVLIRKDASHLMIFGDSLSKTKLEPLYIIDGKEVTNSDFKTLKQDDIESIEVLKDASSKSLYGKKANGGVIIIRTKKAKVAPKKN